MNTLALTLALTPAFVGCACFYLASPHQRWRAAPLPRRPARVAAGVLSLVSLFALTRAMNAVPAVFTFVTWVMVLLVVFPYVGAALRTTKRSR
jgi:hypothetical protein